MRVVMAMVLFWCAAGAARADRVAEPTAPPQEKVLSGTLSWENVKRPDGSTAKGRLLLTVGERQVVMPLTSGTSVKSTKDGETIDVAAFVGKQVKVTAMVVQARSGRREYVLVKSVTRVEDGPASVAQSEVKGEPQRADIKRK